MSSLLHTGRDLKTIDLLGGVGVMVRGGGRGKWTGGAGGHRVGRAGG